MSTARLAVPPGRAGRLWLVQRLAVAHRAGDLLDRKLQVLTAELERAQAAARDSGQEWDAACRDAQRWLLRAVLLGGERAVRLAGVADAEVTITYTVTMGARHPSGGQYTMGEPEGWDGAAVAQARQAHRAALAAAVQHAAATAAVAVMQAETDATRYRLRAVRDRWLPRLSQALAEVEFVLEEQERADAARLRRSREPGLSRSAAR